MSGMFCSFVLLVNQKKTTMHTEKEKPESVVVFDQTSYWVEEGDYKPDVEDEEEIVFTGTFEACSEKCEQLNDELRG